MLKFIRKFQLVILAIGGSLLMVVFLLEPVLTSFQKSQANRTVARYAEGGKVTLFDLNRAKAELELARRIAPVVFMPKQQRGLGLSPGGGVDESDEHAYHWIMLADMAERAGLVGGAEDGRQLIEIELESEIIEISQRLQFAMMQGALTQEEAIAQLEQYEAMRRTQINREIANAAASMRGGTEDDMWRALARFMGAYRLVNLYLTVPAFSPDGARAGLRELNDAVAVNAALIPGDVLAAQIPEPTDAELQAFFEARAGLAPAEDEFGIGYVQPARVRLGWLQLNREQVASGIPADRVELRKIWELDSQKPEVERLYPGDFASERAAIEAAYRQDRADQAMVEADRVIRSQVLAATRSLSREAGRLALPPDWDQLRPRLDTMAEAVVQRLGEQGIRIPTPTVEIRDNQWLSGQAIANLPGIGRAFYRSGNRTILAQELPDQLSEDGAIDALNLQEGVPQADPAAQDPEGNRYYLVVYDHRPAGPARGIDEVGRDRVVADYKAVQGFQRLADRMDELRQAAASPAGVPAAIDLVMADADLTRVQRPEVARNLRVSGLQVRPGPQSRNADPRLNAPAFREAVVEAAAGIDPLASPDSIAADPVGVATAIPQARSVAVARIVAPRPFTAEDFASSFRNAIEILGGQAMRNAIEQAGEGDPFSFEALSERFGLELVGAQDADA